MIVMPMRQQNRLDRSILTAQNTLQMFNVGRFVCIASVEQNASGSIMNSSILNIVLYKHIKYISTHFWPVPIKYVLVPCRVIALGLHPNIRIMLDDNLVTAGIMAPGTTDMITGGGFPTLRFRTISLDNLFCF